MIGGRARWVADLNEFFRDYRLNDVSFTLYAKGQTRNRGLLLSRFFASTALPNYSVSLYLLDISGTTATIDRLRKWLEIVKENVREGGFHWGWLILVSAHDLSPQVESFLERYERSEVGIAFVNAETGRILNSNNRVGKSMTKHLGLSKLIEG